VSVKKNQEKNRGREKKKKKENKLHPDNESDEWTRGGSEGWKRRPGKERRGRSLKRDES